MTELSAGLEKLLLLPISSAWLVDVAVGPLTTCVHWPLIGVASCKVSRIWLHALDSLTVIKHSQFLLFE